MSVQGTRREAAARGQAELAALAKDERQFLGKKRISSGLLAQEPAYIWRHFPRAQPGRDHCSGFSIGQAFQTESSQPVSLKKICRLGCERRRGVGAHGQDKQKPECPARSTDNNGPRRGIDPMCILKNDQERPGTAVLNQMDQQSGGHGRTRSRLHLTRELGRRDVDREDVSQQRAKIQELGSASEQSQNDFGQPSRRGIGIIRYEHTLQKRPPHIVRRKSLDRLALTAARANQSPASALKRSGPTSTCPRPLPLQSAACGFAPRSPLRDVRADMH